MRVRVMLPNLIQELITINLYSKHLTLPHHRQIPLKPLMAVVSK